MPSQGTISIRPVEITDARRIQQLANHPDILKHTDLPDPYEPGTAEIWIQNAVITRAKGDAYECVIELKTDGVIGVCGYIDIEASEHSAEMGFWLGRDYWGNGYGKEACQQLIAMGLEQFQLDYITARVYLDNYVSRHLLESLGFEQMALEEKIVKDKSNVRSVMHYQLSTK